MCRRFSLDGKLLGKSISLRICKSHSIVTQLLYFFVYFFEISLFCILCIFVQTASYFVFTWLTINIAGQDQHLHCFKPLYNKLTITTQPKFIKLYYIIKTTENNIHGFDVKTTEQIGEQEKVEIFHTSVSQN